MVACSGENKPTTNELKTTLTQNIPGHCKLNSFSVEASQNFGNKVEPVYGSRFKASIIAATDLYKKDKSNNEVVFVRLVTQKGKQTEIFGKITSKLYQGAWRHNIDIDGDPIHNLGLPLNQISAARVIIRGSDEEKKYYTKIEQKEKELREERKRKEVELRNNIAITEKILIGSWRDNNSLLTYKSDGTYYVKFDSGGEAIRAWRVEGDLLIVTYKKKKTKNGKWETANGGYTGKFIYIDQNKYTMQVGRNTWSAKRVK